MTAPRNLRSMPTPTATFTGVAYRIADGRPEHRTEGAAWRPMRRRDLLALPVASEAWQWLRAHGVARPSPSGSAVPYRDRAPIVRTTGRLTLSLPAAAISEIQTRAEAAGMSVSAYVARALVLDGSSTK